MSYDEADLSVRLGRIDRRRRAGFSTACAERLWHLYARFVARTGEGDQDALGELIQRIWRAVVREDVDLSGLDTVAENLAPADDDSRYPESAYAQNAAICAAYALSCWIQDSAQDAVFAARQVYDVADFVAQQIEEGRTFTADMEERIRDSPHVREAVRAIDSYLAAAECSDVDWDELRDRAREEGRLWAAVLP